MPRTKSAVLTDAELPLMQILWHKGHGTVGEVVQALPRGRAPAYNTVLTLLRILERKGYVTHQKDGRAFIYRPVIDQRRARHRVIRHLLTRFFDGSPRLLVLNLLEHGTIDRRELRRLRQLIEHSE